LSALLYQAIQEANTVLARDIKARAGAGAAALSECDSTTWRNNLPLLSEPTFCMCVYDTSGNFRCGSSCTWTVPSGVTKIQFQLWGPGASMSGGRCCGGNPYGMYGAYATTIIDAVEGCQYTICGGCSYCCYAYCTTQNSGYCSCPSYVTGYGLTNFCAKGAKSGLFQQMCLLHGNSCCRFQAKGNSQSGPCICSTGSWYCFDNSCATCGEIPIQVDCCINFCGTEYGLCGIHTVSCLDTNNYGYHLAPDWIDVCHCCSANSCCCATQNGGNSCKPCCFAATAGATYRRIPGVGGAYGKQFGGCTGQCGDSGRMGMVRVTAC